MTIVNDFKPGDVVKLFSKIGNVYENGISLRKDQLGDWRDAIVPQTFYENLVGQEDLFCPNLPLIILETWKPETNVPWDYKVMAIDGSSIGWLTVQNPKKNSNICNGLVKI